MPNHTNNIVVVDYGAGNLQSVLNALDYLKCSYKVATTGSDISEVINAAPTSTFTLLSGSEASLVVAPRSLGWEGLRPGMGSGSVEFNSIKQPACLPNI